MNEHHYLGALPKIGHTLWYVACYHDTWVALISFQLPLGNVLLVISGLAGVIATNTIAYI